MTVVHGSVSEAIKVVLMGSSTLLAALQNFEEDLQALALELEKCAERFDSSTHSLMSLINRVSPPH